jgi:TPR repeat protein
MYVEGTHVTQDPALAMRWLTRAAQGGNAFAQAWYGDILSQGRGTPFKGMRVRLER